MGKNGIRESRNEMNIGNLERAESNGGQLNTPFPTLSPILVSHYLQNKIKTLTWAPNLLFQCPTLLVHNIYIIYYSGNFLNVHFFTNIF